MNASIAGWRPQRTYPTLVGHPYPDDSAPLGVLGVIRSFRTTGQQMWDEDVNNMHRWLGKYASRYAHWWRLPRVPYYRPVFFVDIRDPQQRESWSEAAGYPYPNDVVENSDFINTYLQVWPGVKCAVFADRIVAAFSGEVWRGVASWDWYKDIIEIAVFASQVRRGEVIASYKAVKGFYFDGAGPGCRMRGWSGGVLSSPPEILKNGFKVGFLWSTPYASGARFSGRVEFQPGDVLSIKAPDQRSVHGLRNPCFTLIGGLL